MKTMILYRDPKWFGGVVSFVELLRANFNGGWQTEQYQIGLRFDSQSRFSNLLLPLRDALGLFHALGRSRPDVVHVNPSLNLASVLRDGLFMLVLRVFGKRSVFVFWHGWEEGVAKRIRTNWLLRNIFRAVFGRAGHSVVLASRFRDELLAMGFPPERVSVESTMFDGTQFNGVKRQAHDGITLLFLSRMEPTKGALELVEAFARLKNKYPALRLILAGDGPAKKELETRVMELGVSDVAFPGYLRGADKAQALLDADIFAFPTYYGEGCPVSLLEAMAAGLPCITNSVGGIPDIFQDGANGVLLDGVSVDTVTNALERLLGDPEQLARIAEHNRKEAWEKYEASVVTRRIVSLYQEVVKLDAAR
ncbi:MAG: glycosyltransferase family 4 protein [Thiobacillus sp.]